MNSRNPLPILAIPVFIVLVFSGCSQKHSALLVSSITGHYLDTVEVSAGAAAGEDIPVYEVGTGYAQTMDGFGAVFNELGWDALQLIPAVQKQEIMRDFFTEEGFNFTICRMPVGANDYARNWYSLNETPGDFPMEHFNIDRDLSTLIPYISEALAIRPDLKIWGSPWCPPSWMKVNKHYACLPAAVNDLPQEGAGMENKTQFIMEDRYLEAYALYFVKYIQAYREQGIDIYAVHVQNEPNSCQNFPSCVWTARDLNTFIGRYLGPAFDSASLDTEIWYGTIERPSVEKVDTVLQDPFSSKYVKGVGFQWAGKECIPGVHFKYPEMKLMQTESECGDGSNDWPAAEYTWSLMKHYMENGANAYLYWNPILDETGKSMWGWKQNSLISVDSETGMVTRNPEFYLMKHLSGFVLPGARRLETPPGMDFALLFENPGGEIAGLMVNSSDENKKFALAVGGQSYLLELQPHSINTFIKP